ncbi:hypothetical protein AHAS_Ahas18G0085600 [Arachis hypogaea]
MALKRHRFVFRREIQTLRCLTPVSYQPSLCLSLQNVSSPTRDKSISGHFVTFKETVEACSAKVSGASTFEISGTPVDCVSLALSWALFSWSKPLLVISGINRGSSYGHHMKKDESQETDFKDAAEVCLPLINAAIRDVEKGTFFKSCFLNIEIPTSPSKNKVCKISIFSNALLHYGSA